MLSPASSFPFRYSDLWNNTSCNPAEETRRKTTIQQLTVALWNAQLLNSNLKIFNLRLIVCFHYAVSQKNQPRWFYTKRRTSFSSSTVGFFKNQSGFPEITLQSRQNKSTGTQMVMGKRHVQTLDSGKWRGVNSLVHHLSHPIVSTKSKNSICWRNNWLQFKELISLSGNKSSKSGTAPCFFPIPQIRNEDRNSGRKRTQASNRILEMQLCFIVVENGSHACILHAVSVGRACPRVDGLPTNGMVTCNNSL